jgi:predicted DnaQ family exonuclease/DinG family helicase
MTDRPRSYPRTFVGVDLETTGVDPREDRIIEIGAVRIVDGEVDDAMSAFVNPGVEIPSDVVYLTGITDEDVATAPPVEEVIPGFLEFIADAPLVAHSAPFDTAFLEAAARDRPDLALGERTVFDTLILSRALVPRLGSHRLASLADFFGIEHERAHRAGDDAMAVSVLFLRLLGVLDRVGSALLGRMASLADPATRLLIDAARERSEGRLDPFAVPAHGEGEAKLLRYDNVRRGDLPRVPVDEKLEIDIDELESLFDTDGAIGSLLPGYETRREQVEMMRAVGDALTSGIHLVVEAGTGVGKSLAYLVPSIHFAALNGERVIVSTNTKNLQEQLFLKDIPFLERALDTDFSASLLKGRGNYLCLDRYRQILARGLSPEERAQLLPIVLWEEETRSGDISENGGFRFRGYLWGRLSAEGGPCLGARCPLNERCYLMNARRASQAAHIVIVNHSLLFSDTEAENRILGEYSYLIADEAHNVEGVATEHLGKRANVWRARAILDSLHRLDGAESGDLAELLDTLGGPGEAGILDGVVTAAERLKDDVAEARRAAEAFFGALSARHVELNRGREVEYGTLRYRAEESVAWLLSSELSAAVDAFEAVARGCDLLADLVLDTDTPKVESVVSTLAFHADRSRQFSADIDFLARADDPESVFWLEVRRFREDPDCALRSAPVSVAELMESFLYSRVDSLVATSATLTVDDRFDFVMERLGLDRLPDWKVLPLNVGSPYDHDSQSVAVVAGYFPEPSSGGFNARTAELLIQVAAGAEGGTLVLFTSRSALDAVFKLVRDPLTARGKLVLAQGHGGGASALLDRFAKSVDSVLLATSSFWEGVDVPGRSLEQLVIAKLPFPVPSNPVVEAHCERYDAAGENAFARYMIPRTAIRLRQGFGRLIRSTTDWGVVVFLDSRLKTRRYGERLLSQLPTQAVIAESEAELLAVVSGIEAEHRAA